jgi:anti-sigma B factor antagonist
MDRDELVFTIEVRPSGDGALVAPHGELDMGTQEELRAVLQEHAATGAVTLDLAGIQFLDTSGMRLILETAEAARRDGFRFTVLPGTPAVQRLFEIAGVLELVPFRKNGEGAGS